MILLCISFGVALDASPELESPFKRLQEAYPDHIQTIDEQFITWSDGTKMPSRALAEQLEQRYVPGKQNNQPTDDPGRVRYEPFFRKMYGNSPAEVEANLVEIDWMPGLFGKGTYPLQLTTVNNVHEKLQCVSDELELLVARHPEFCVFLENPGGTYYWRNIANTDRLSMHSFGMTIDINTDQSHYWQWDLEKAGLPISEETELSYRNAIPWEIVLIFEKYGFIWGGKWYHYDTMHFEYRPELVAP